MRSSMELHSRAYGRDLVIPKHHHQMHCPEQFLEDDGVYDMLVVERLNLQVKAVGDPIDNARRWEYSLLCSPLTRQQNQFAGSTLLTPAPLGRIVDMPGNPSVKIANRVRAYGKELAVSDFVLREGVCGVISACCEENGVLYLLADEYDIVDGQWQSCEKYRDSGQLIAVRMRSVRAAHAWYVSRDDFLMDLFRFMYVLH